MSVNKPFKSGMRMAAGLHFAEEVRSQRAAGVAAADLHLDLKMSTIKPLLAGWIRAGLQAVSVEAALGGWRKATLLQA